MALDKQIHMHSIDTSAFYKNKEKKIHNKLNKIYILRGKFKKRIHKYRKKNRCKIKNKNKETLKEFNKLKSYVTRCNKLIDKNKDLLLSEFKKNKNIRHLDNAYLIKKNIISIFSSSLVRVMDIPIDTLTEDLIIVQTYFFNVIEDIILDGFIYNKEKYICLTASAGQIRTKKTVFIKEKTLLKCQNTLMCGLSVEVINALGGININKYLAYLALCNSATDEWEDFDIEKCIVVDDFETTVNSLVDFINDETYNITRDCIDIPITHTDGAGMILPQKCKKNRMIRPPWIKGLLIPTPFDVFIKKANEKDGNINHGIIKDIYGKEWDVLNDEIEIIFTKSQFKMWKYYNSWQDYVDKFNKYNCQAGYCNEEEDIFNNAKINYQMLQTLTDITDDELKDICKTTIHNIKNIGRDKRTMLKILGVTKSNVNKNYLQQALEIYPELLIDTYSKEILKQVKRSMVKNGRAGKVDIDGVYTFICPDVYAFCEYLFLGDNDPKGLLKDGEVFCKLYSDGEKLDCLRSPHLYREHAIRKNTIGTIDSIKRKDWFITNGLYTSCKDAISKLLMFDVDGDKALVCREKTLVDVAERNMKDIVPLYYNMKKADSELISNQSIYNGLKTAYTGGNIGLYSNDISKIWNSDNINLEAIRLLCMENNFTIDYAKTLYKPKRPKEKNKLITQHTKSKVPHFFIYAKDKDVHNVEKINNSVVNRLNKIIPNIKISFTATNLGKFDYKLLMKDKNVEIDNDIIKKYTELDLNKKFIDLASDDNENNSSDNLYIYKDIRNQILEVNNDVYYVTDVLIEYLYKNKNSNYKTTLWSSFGDIIVENLKNNIKKPLNDGYIMCEICGRRVENTSNRQKYCEDCAKDIDRYKAKERMKNIRE